MVNTPTIIIEMDTIIIEMDAIIIEMDMTIIEMDTCLINCSLLTKEVKRCKLDCLKAVDKLYSSEL